MTFAARPPAISPGDAVRIVATGGAVNPSSLASGVSLLNKTYGLNVRQDASVLYVDLYYAGADDVRGSGVLKGLNESDTSAIWAARGGYGTARLLDLPYFQETVLSALHAQPRWLIGYSDLTALHAIWARAGVLSVHGHMVSDIQLASQQARDRLFEVIGGNASTIQTFSGSIRHRGIRRNDARGRLLGGNLSVLASLIGSGYLPSFEGAVLFFEDTDEAPYRLDRLLRQLLCAPEFAGIVAIAIGQFFDGHTKAYTTLDLLDRTLAPLGIPVLTGLAIGHNSSIALPIVLGAEAEVDLELEQLRVYVPAV